MLDSFREKLNEARICLEQGHPFWCDEFSRPIDQEFENFLKDNGFAIYYLYFAETWEGVYSPLNFMPEELERIANKRDELRKAGVPERELPSSL